MLLQAAKRFSKILDSPDTNPISEYQNHFPGRFRLPARMPSSTLLERLKVHYIVGSGSRQATGNEPLGLGFRKPGGSIGSPMEHLESLSSFHIWDMRRAGV